MDAPRDFYPKVCVHIHTVDSGMSFYMCVCIYSVERLCRICRSHTLFPVNHATIFHVKLSLIAMVFRS